jgi:GLPGLI family protein
MYKLYNDKWSKIFYDNGTVSLTRIPRDGKELVYQSSPEIIKLTGKSKTIGKFKCQEAMVAKAGRNYQIWFSGAIPVNMAPFGIDKLPGLAIELQEIGGEKTHIKLVKINNMPATAQYQSHKKYILNKKPLTYETYKKEITRQVTGAKKENNVAIAEVLAKYNVTNSGGIEFSEDQLYYVCHLVDIPENLVKDLQKIK